MKLQLLCMILLSLTNWEAAMLGNQNSPNDELRYYETEEWKRGQAKLAKQWNDALNTKLPYASDVDLFNRFNYIQVETKASMSSFKGRERTSWLIRSSQQWMDRIFRHDFRPQLAELRPLRILKRPVGRPSLLYYEWSTDGYDFAMWESSSAVLVRACNANDSDLNICGADDANAIINKLFVHDPKYINREIPPLKRYYKGQEEVYAPNGRCNFNRSAHWQDSMVVIIGNKEMYVLAIKVATGMRMDNGKMVRTLLLNKLVQYNEKWLEMGLEKVQE